MKLKTTLSLLVIVVFTTLNSQTKSINLSIYQPNIENCLTIIESNFSPERLNVFPNPTHGLFTLTLNNSEFTGKFKVIIYNLQGQVIYTDQNYLPENYIKKEINLSGFPAGRYLITISTKNQYYHSKISIY
jgi:hypothetical protein